MKNIHLRFLSGTTTDKAVDYFLFKRSALVITETELKLIAAAAIIGLSNIPKNGYNTPAAIGIPTELYTKAKNRFCLIFRITL